MKSGRFCPLTKNSVSVIMKWYKIIFTHISREIVLILTKFGYSIYDKDIFYARKREKERF